MSDFLTLTIYSGLLFFLITTIYLIKRNIKLKKEIDFKSRDVIFIENILNGLPHAWCAWVDGERYIHASHTFRQLFRIDSSYQLKYEDLTRLFGDSSLSPFQRGLNHIILYGGNFLLEIETLDPPLYLEVSGTRLDYDLASVLGEEDSKDLIKRSVIIISFKNISVEIEEKKNLLLIQNEQEKEINLLRILIDIAPLALWSRDQNGRLQYCNMAYAGALETTVKRAIKENRELIERHGEISSFELSKKAIQTQSTQTLHTHIVIAGQRRFLEITEISLPQNTESNSIHSVGYAMDLTSTKEIEDELSQTINSYQDILNFLSTPIAIYGSNKKIEFFNKSYCMLMNLDEDWLLTGPTLSEVLEVLREKRKLPEYSDFKKYKQELLSLFNNLLEPIHEVVHQPDGVILRLVLSPTPSGGLLFLFEDITHSLTLEQRYHTLMAVQKETLDHLYEAIAVIGTDYRLHLTNPSMIRIWEINEENYQEGIHINIFLNILSQRLNNSHNAKVWRKDVMDIIYKRHPITQNLFLKSGKVLECTYVPLPDGGHLLTFVEITDTWKIQQNLKERNQDLERQDRLKSDFISHISYELRSPLHTISGFIEILLNQYFGELNEKQLDYCRGISDSTEKLMNLINDMLDLASIEAGKLNLHYQEGSIDNLMQSVLSLVQNRAYDHGVEIILENQTPHQTAKMDVRRMKHALFNLLHNAIKFTPSGGRITFGAYQNLENENYLDFIIQDTGIGISEDDQERIFKLFEHGTATQSTQVGAGLGLTLVKSLIELHGGSIQLESKINEGTKVTCTIPILN